MSQDPSQRANEDASQSAQHAENARENRDALADQARRTESSAPDTVDHRQAQAAPGPDGGLEAAENRDALADEARRVERTLPDDVDTGRRD